MLQRVGEVIGMADGKVCVRWASGQESQLPPQVRIRLLLAPHTHSLCELLARYWISTFERHVDCIAGSGSLMASGGFQSMDKLCNAQAWPRPQITPFFV